MTRRRIFFFPSGTVKKLIDSTDKKEEKEEAAETDGSEPSGHDPIDVRSSELTLMDHVGDQSEAEDDEDDDPDGLIDERTGKIISPTCLQRFLL